MGIDVVETCWACGVRHPSGENHPCSNRTLGLSEGEVFELMLDGNAPENQPLAMVAADGYDPRYWKHNGPKVEGRQTRKFKLVSVDLCWNIDEVRRKLAAHGEIPEGQWRQAYKVAYNIQSRKGPIGIAVADPSWTTPSGFRCFPYITSFGASRFWAADNEFQVHWRWLVSI
ncbi:hypothetical protein EPN81_01590 [Patescibacteria group bacterium]|nr:MAG: hypothetical protein EPN81_01590 [Patescibacteria group bacterium]